MTQSIAEFWSHSWSGPSGVFGKNLCLIAGVSELRSLGVQDNHVFLKASGCHKSKSIDRLGGGEEGFVVFFGRGAGGRWGVLLGF